MCKAAACLGPKFDFVIFRSRRRREMWSYVAGVQYYGIIAVDCAPPTFCNSNMEGMRWSQRSLLTQPPRVRGTTISCLQPQGIVGFNSRDCSSIRWDGLNVLIPQDKTKHVSCMRSEKHNSPHFYVPAFETVTHTHPHSSCHINITLQERRSDPIIIVGT